MKHQDFLTTEGKVDIKKCIMHHDKQDVIYPLKYYVENHVQPPKVVEQKHPDLKLSKDWVMPVDDSAHHVELLTLTLFRDQGAMGGLFNAFVKVNPELKGIRPDQDDYSTYLFGFTSAFNLNDIQAFVVEGHALARSEMHRMRSRLASGALGMHMGWVLSDQTLTQVEKYVNEKLATSGIISR